MKRHVRSSISLLIILLLTVISTGCKQTRTAVLSDFFKSTDWVAQHAGDSNFVIVDTRPAVDYAAGHIPGAINIPRTKFYFSRTQVDGNTIAYDIPTPAELVDILTANGITPDSTVVAYDTDTSSYGGRFPWVLRSYGHEKAYVIDGGADKWKDADKREWTTEPVTPLPGDAPYAIAAYGKYRVTKGDVAGIIDRDNGYAIAQGYVISDVRTPSEYTGFVTSVTSGTVSGGQWSVSETPYVASKTAGARPGHIPFAKFSDYATDVFRDYLDTSGNPVPSSLQAGHNVKVLKSEADILAHFQSLGITKDKTIYSHCEGGFRSSVYTLILLGLGYPKVYNYDGSWNEWSLQNDSLYPVATGDGRDGSRP